jgi:hypothetical protein
MIRNRKENDCGVCAVANARDIGWATAALRIFGEKFTNKLRFNTKTRQIAAALHMRSFALTRVKSWHDIPDRSIVKVIPSACEGTNNWHWVVWRDGMVWDSCHVCPITPDKYNHRLVSYLWDMR